MASSINVLTTGAGGIATSGDSSGVLALQKDGTTNVTINSSGNVGIGVTPNSTLASYKSLDLGGSGSQISATSGVVNIAANALRNTSWTYAGTNYATLYQQDATAGIHTWYTAPSGSGTISWSERMRIDSSGNVLVGTTSGTANARLVIETIYGTNTGIGVKSTSTSSSTMMTFVNPNGGVGTIISSGSSTSYNTSSDYRLKENIAPMTGALDVVSQLKPVTYNWKADGSEGQGFIAHELQAIVPDCVTGEKDAVDEEGNPVYQGIDTSFLVATLTKAIQEQQELIKQLQADVAALKGAN